MSLSFRCSSCSKPLRVKDELAGKRIRCPGCGQPQAVPAQAAVAAAEGQGQPQPAKKPTPQQEPSTAGKRPKPAGRRTRREANRPPWPWVAGAAAVLVVVGAVAGVFVLGRSKPPAEPAPAAVVGAGPNANQLSDSSKPSVGSGPTAVVSVTPTPREPGSASEEKPPRAEVPEPKEKSTPPSPQVPPEPAPGKEKAKEPDNNEPFNPYKPVDPKSDPGEKKPMELPAKAGPQGPPEPKAPASTLGEVIHELKGHTERVTALAFTPDGRRALTGSEDRTMRLWDLQTGQEVRRFEGDKSNFVSIVVYPDGRRAVSAANTEFGGLLLWDLDTGKEVKRLEPKERNHFGALALSGDGRRLLAGGMSTAHQWDLPTGRELTPIKQDGLGTFLKGNVGSVRVKSKSRTGSAGFSPSVGLLANARQALMSNRTDALVHVFDTTTGKHLRQFGNPNRDLWVSVAFSADGRLVLTGSGGELEVNRQPVPIDFGVRLWDVATGRMLHHCKGHTQTVDCLALSRDGKRALSAGADNVVIHWNLETGEEIGRLTGTAGDVRCLALSPDCRQALTANPTGSVQLWNLAGRAPLIAKEVPGGEANKPPGTEEKPRSDDPKSDIAKGTQPEEKRGKLTEKEEKLRTTLRRCGDYQLGVTSDNLDVTRIAWDTLGKGKIDFGDSLFLTARAVARKEPKGWFSVRLPVNDKNLTLTDLRQLLGKEDSTSKDSLEIPGQFGPQYLPVTWHFYGWCGFGVTADGKVAGLKADCKLLPADDAP